MAKLDAYAPGQFSWVDLLTPSAESSIAFYEALFGWSHRDVSEDGGGLYVQFTCEGLDVCGLGEMGDEMRGAGVPAAWNSYVQVRELEKQTERAVQLGGSLVMPPMDITTAGRMSILADPEGAKFSLWQARDHHGAGLVNEPVSFAWNELLTRDAARAKSYYGDLFGWTYRSDDSGYHEILNGERSNGGMLPWQAEMGEMPAAWSTYFSVVDCDATVERVKELGGSLLAGPVDIEVGRFAVMLDPLGAVFNVMKIHKAD